MCVGSTGRSECRENREIVECMECIENREIRECREIIIEYMNNMEIRECMENREIIEYNEVREIREYRENIIQNQLLLWSQNLYTHSTIVLLDGNFLYSCYWMESFSP